MFFRLTLVSLLVNVKANHKLIFSCLCLCVYRFRKVEESTVLCLLFAWVAKPSVLFFNNWFVFIVYKEQRAESANTRLQNSAYVSLPAKLPYYPHWVVVSVRGWERGS